MEGVLRECNNDILVAEQVLRRKATKWNKRVFEDVRQQKVNLKARLLEIEKAIALCPTEYLLQLED